MASRESRVRRGLIVLDGEAWSWRRHADVCLLPRCGNFRSLKRFVAVTAGALHEGRSGNLQRQNALLHHFYAVLEPASQDPSHETEWGWPATRSGSPWMQRARALGDSATTASETSASVAAHFEREERDPGGVRSPKCERRQREGWQERRARRGVIRSARTRQGILRSLACPTSQRARFREVGESLSPLCLKELGKRSPFASACQERACPAPSWMSDPDSKR